MKSGLPEMLHCLNASSEMSVLERQCSRLKWQQEQSMGHQPVICFDENDGSFLGFNGDQGLCELVVNGAMKPDPGLENGFSDGFRSFLSGSDFQMSCSLPSCPPAEGKESSKKRKADKTQILKAVEERPEEKKMKGQTDETEQKSSTTTTTTTTASTGANNKTKASEAPKTDYIHVRARRGQATDSHSLAERVRREKISERMKYLQDLVPGCNKITGKAGMLDEIINYVQSLQRQVEFLSMKLAAINPRLDFNVEDYLVKGMFPATSELVNQANLQFDAGVLNTSLEMVANPMDIALRRTISAPVTIPQTIFESNQMQNITWDDELQNLYSMEYQQGRASTSFFPQPFTGFQESGHVKLEM